MDSTKEESGDLQWGRRSGSMTKRQPSRADHMPRAGCHVNPYQAPIRAPSHLRRPFSISSAAVLHEVSSVQTLPHHATRFLLSTIVRVCVVTYP